MDVVGYALAAQLPDANYTYRVAPVPVSWGLKPSAVAHDGQVWALLKDAHFWSYSPTTNAWTQRADFPGAASAMLAVNPTAGKIYAAMGGPVSSGQLWVYDVASNTWTQLAAAPTSAHWRTAHAVVCRPNGDVVCHGGYLETQNPTTGVYSQVMKTNISIWSAATSTWSLSTVGVAARHSHGAYWDAATGYLVVAGGIASTSNSTHLTTIQRYTLDGSLGPALPGPAMVNARLRPVITPVTGKTGLYIVGGQEEGSGGGMPLMHSVGATKVDVLGVANDHTVPVFDVVSDDVLYSWRNTTSTEGYATTLVPKRKGALLAALASR